MTKDGASTDNLDPSQKTPSADAEHKMQIDEKQNNEQPPAQPIAQHVQHTSLHGPPDNNNAPPLTNARPADGWGTTIRGFFGRTAGAGPVTQQSDYAYLYQHYHGKYQLKKEELARYRIDFQRESEKVLKLQRQNEHLRQECEALKKCAAEFKAHNEEFRTQILAMSSGRGPVLEEEFYIQSFEELKGVVEHGTVKLSRAQADGTLPNENQMKVLELVSGLGLNGKHSADYFRSNESLFPTVYNTGRWRNPLIRHIVALYLFDRIFEPFAFGISQELSEGLKQIEMDVILRGPQF